MYNSHIRYIFLIWQFQTLTMNSNPRQHHRSAQTSTIYTCLFFGNLPRVEIQWRTENGHENINVYLSLTFELERHGFRSFARIDPDTLSISSMHRSCFFRAHPEVVLPLLRRRRATKQVRWPYWLCSELGALSQTIP